MSEDGFVLARVERLDDLREDDEVLLIHRKESGINYAVHGIVCGFDHENSFLGVDEGIKLLLDTCEIEGKANSRVKVPQADFNDPNALYEFLRGYRKGRRESWYVFRSNGCWEAYRIDEPKHEAQPDPVSQVM